MIGGDTKIALSLKIEKRELTQYRFLDPQSLNILYSPGLQG
jgi:hypothetical protein